MQWAAEFNPKMIRAAADLARRAAEQFPDRPGNWITLARLLINLGDSRVAVECLREGTCANPECIELRLVLARALELEGRWEEALSETRRVREIAPDNPDTKITHFELLTKLGDWEAAGKLADDIAVLSPMNRRLLAYYDHSCSAEILLSFCDARLAQNPVQTSAQYFKALTLARLGRAQEARDVISFNHLVEITDLPVPAGYTDKKAFLDALAEEITHNPTLSPDSRGSSLHGGKKVRCLRQPGAVAIEGLLTNIKHAVDAYERRVAGLPYGFATGRPAHVQLGSWAVVFGGEDHQRSHWHHRGWLSGVFYVTAPRPSGVKAYRGPLVLGALDSSDQEIEPPWGTLDVEPVPGRLVMFPSYVPHATLPTGIEDARITVGFDVIPATIAESASDRTFSLPANG
jgi:tetratricopeptide (TPR) repeat protein